MFLDLFEMFWSSDGVGWTMITFTENGGFSRVITDPGGCD